MSWFKRSAPTPDLPRSFGYKIQWLAVRHDDPMRVAEAIGLRKLKPATWAKGIAPGLSPPIFVTPVLDGWVLAVEFPLPEDAVSVLGRVSSELRTRVCHFASHRGVSMVSWGVAENGKVQRLYTYADGQTYANHGDPMPEEVELGLRYGHEFDNIEGEVDDDDWDKLPDEGTVLVLAGKWSIDPMTIEERFTEPSTGWTGKG
jgi:hypothetical protein